MEENFNISIANNLLRPNKYGLVEACAIRYSSQLSERWQSG
jgi:hypothetical protein